MQMGDILDNFPPLHDYDTAARLLSQLCPDSVKNSVEVDFGSPESFACLFYRSSNLFRHVEDARASRNFETIWKICINYFARVKNTRRRFSRPDNVPLILEKISANLNDLINGKANQVLWTLDKKDKDNTSDVEKVDLGFFTEMREPPSMLLHELGSFQSDLVLRERVQRLFRKEHNTFLVNASATGKTRLLYEGLCRYWGLYITSHADEGEARALDTTLDRRIYYEEDLVRHLPHKSSLAFEPILAKNREIAARRFSAVLLAHLLILRDFLKACNADKGIEEIQKRRWLIAQLVCKILNRSDPFREILVAIEFEPLEFMDEQLMKVIKDIQILLPHSVRTDGFFVVIDEANVAIREIWSSPEDSGPYPALKEIIRTWRDRLALFEGVPITFVVAGTQIPQSYFPPSSQEWSSWRWTSDTGAFDDPEVQKRYVLSFLPSSLARTPRAEALFRHIWDWCRPRHRLTASLVAMLLMDGVVHPHGVLDKYVKRLTGFAAFDSKTMDYITEEGPCMVDAFFANIGSTVRGYPAVQSTTHEVIMHYIITGYHPPYFGIGKVDLVSSGIGQFKDKDMSQISLDQPGPLIAAAVWLSDKSPPFREKPRSLTSFNDFCFYARGHWANGDTYAPASYIALYLAHVFKTAGEHLFSSIFTIPTPPAWLAAIRKFPTQLVKLQKNEHGIIKEMTVTPSALLPDAPPLGYSAPSADDVLAWLRHERPGVFCVCPPDCEADLIFVLKRCDGYIWVALRTAGRGSTASLNPKYVYPEYDFSEDGMPPWSVDANLLGPDVLSHEYERLTVKNLFSRNEINNDDLLDALKALPNGLAPAGQLSLLHVVAAFPSEPTYRQLKTKVSPVAVLNTATFKAVTEAIPSQDLIQTLVFSMHSKRSSRYPDDAFSPIKSLQPLPSKKRRAKRKTPETETSRQKDILEHENSSSTSAMDPPSEPETPVKRAKRKGVRSRVGKS